MTHARAWLAQLLAFTGWYAIWGWIFASPLWGWSMPWEAFRWPLTATATLLTWGPVDRWLRFEETARPPAGNNKEENEQ